MRSTIAASLLLASMIGIDAAGAAECPAGAMGVSRTIVVDPSEHVRLGAMQYNESLPLRDREVVLTFDDGPLPPYTSRVLDTLASECVKATFFLVGRMVRGYPAIARRIYNEGHTVANHSQSHPFTFHKMSVDQASQEIEDGFASLRWALGDPKAVAPFFRIPGLLRQNSVEQYLAAHNYMTWSVDFAADDWTHINAQEIARRAISRIEARGKGILLLHDIQPATALAFPEILKELKARGFKIVHVVPATPDRPKTVTEPELWAVRHTPEPKIWPRTLVTGESPEPVLAAPSSRQFRHREVRAGDQGRDGTDLRAQGRQRRQRNGAAVAPVAAPGGLLGTGGCPCAARAGRAQFQVFPRIPIGATRQTEGGGQEARGGQASRGAAVQRPVRTSAGGPSARLWSPAERGAAADQCGECAADALNAQPAIAVAFDPLKNKFAGSLTRRTVDRFGPCGALTACFAFSAVKAAATSRWHHQQRQRRQ